MGRPSLPAAAVLYTALTVVATWPLAAEAGRAVTDLGDPLLNAWVLAWVARGTWVSPGGLFDANILHPEAGSLGFAESMLLPAALMAPALYLGASPLFAQNLLLLAAWVLSGIATFALVRSLTGHAGAALVAGAVFALYPYRVEALPKVQLQIVWWLPLAALAVHRVVERPGWRRGAALAALGAAQAYSCLYYAVYGAIWLAVVAAGVVLVAPRDRWWPATRVLAGAAALAALAVWPLAAPYRAAARAVGERTPDDVAPYSAVPADYTRVHPENALRGNPRHPGRGERRLFPGATATLLAATAFVPAAPAALAYGAGALVAANFSLGFNGLGYRTLYDHVEPVRALRVPARFGMLVGLSLAVLAGVGVARLVRGRRPADQAVVVILAIAAVTLESRMRPQVLTPLPDPDPAVYRWLADQPRGVVCEYPVGDLEGRAGPQDATYQYYSTRHWQPLVNGYSGFEPASYRALKDRLRGFPDEAAIAYLRDRGVRYLLVHGAFYIRGDFDADVGVLRRHPALEWVGAFAWAGRRPTAVFRVAPPAR